MDQQSCRSGIAADLGALGILPGDTLLVHSSLKALGPVPGGIETMIRGFLDAIGAGGTLLMPALSWALRPPEVFDVRLTPTNVGAIAEYFRTRQGTCRSLHPTHSVCAVGPRTRELLDDHDQDGTPCGPHSPFRKVAETNGKIVMLGCGLKPNTSLHAFEECVAPPYLYGPAFEFTLRDGQGNTIRKAYRTHGFDLHGFAQRYDKVLELCACSSFLRSGQVLQALTFVLDAPLLKRAVLGKLAEDPFFFVEAVSKLSTRTSRSGGPP
jgi:aminoglycoside 3-N-acetyltransferase